VEYDVYSNAFIVTDIKPKLDEVERLIRRMDVPPSQVFIDVKFVSTTRTDLTNFGIDWTSGITGSVRMGSVASRFPFTRGRGGWEDNLAVVDDGPPAVRYDPATGTLVPGGTIIPDSGYYNFGTINLSQLAQVVNMLKADSETRILQAPKILTLDNRESTIFVGSNISYAEVLRSSSQVGVITQTGIREAENSPVETGFQLLIIPHVIPGKNKVLMTIIPEDESLVARPQLNPPAGLLPGFERFVSGADSIDLPQVQRRTVVTRLMVDDGQTIVIGGLIVQSKGMQINKVPILGDIPGLRWFFRNEKETLQNENLMIFMTVKIVYNAEDVEKLYKVHRVYEGGFESPVEKLFKDPDKFQGLPELDAEPEAPETRQAE